MGAELSVVLDPRCPGQDDPGVEKFLHLARTTCGAGWIELALTPDGFGERRVYASGKRSGPSTTIRLDVGTRYTAEIEAGTATAPKAETTAALAAFLSCLLENRALRIETALFRGVVNTSSSAALVFGDQGEIIFANPPADRLLSLQTEDELLAETKGEPSQPLLTLLCSFVDRARDSSTDDAAWKGTLYLADGRFMAYEVSRIRTTEDVGLKAVLVIVRPIGSGSKVRVETFANRHDLSPRQREVVQLLVDGLTTVAMADALGISPHTVRDHLKHLYRKTGSNSRGELLGLVSRTAPAKTSDG